MTTPTPPTVPKRPTPLPFRPPVHTIINGARVPGEKRIP